MQCIKARYTKITLDTRVVRRIGMGKKIKGNGNKRQTKINKGQGTSVPYRDGISI